TSSFQSSAEQNDAFIEKSAQIAADNDNFGTANDCLTKVTPVAVVNGGNIHALHDLHPRETYPPSSPSRCRIRFRNSNEIVFNASTIVNDILHLKKGKAPGLQVDSLDIFIHLAQRCRNGSAKKKQLTPFTSTLAKFFTIVANADYPEKIQKQFQTTYLVAFQKDPNNLTKLRPLGIPSTFASHLLPHNYAVGIHGGIDFVTTTLRLGVEKYISNQTDIGLLPSRALVSLDIRNMFNAISRHKLREIVRDEFLCLQSFINSLYATPGKSCVKMSDGDWEDIVVSKGFSQGCPLSPILAAIVLNYILKQVDTILQARAKSRPAANSDDGLGGLAIILAYVDDANFLVPLDDVEPLLRAFQSVAEPLGTIMNTAKTHILTSTSGTSILPQLLVSNPTLHDSISAAISTPFSRKTNPDHTTSPLEVITGLRILGVPIGNDDFCTTFHLQRVEAAAADAKKVISGLNDKQTMLRVFKTSTLHKVTHLFVSDVASSNPTMLPTDWHLWSSAMSTRFSEIMNSFLCGLLSATSIPAHTHRISTASTANAHTYY
ncbi:hypothetical protein ACHAXR_003079, partial [Thalassiosira sp. AJA248-18]